MLCRKFQMLVTFQLRKPVHSIADPIDTKDRASPGAGARLGAHSFLIHATDTHEQAPCPVSSTRLGQGLARSGRQAVTPSGPLSRRSRQNEEHQTPGFFPTRSAGFGLLPAQPGAAVGFMETTPWPGSHTRGSIQTCTGRFLGPGAAVRMGRARSRVCFGLVSFVLLVLLGGRPESPRGEGRPVHPLGRLFPSTVTHRYAKVSPRGSEAGHRVFPLLALTEQAS